MESDLDIQHFAFSFLNVYFCTKYDNYMQQSFLWDSFAEDTFMSTEKIEPPAKPLFQPSPAVC